MKRHYIQVAGGDEVLIDLGGYGILCKLDRKHLWYDVEYVGIQYDEAGGPIPFMIPADMTLFKRGIVEDQLAAAEMVRIFRHKARP